MEGVFGNIRAVRLHSPFDRGAAMVYAALALQIATTTLLIVGFGFRVQPGVWALVSFWPLLIMGGMAFRRLGMDRTATGFESLGVLHCYLFVCTIAIVAVSAFRAPYADALLASWDDALLFPWAAFVDALRPYPTIMGEAYRSFVWQSPILIAFLCWKGDTARVWAFVTAAAITLSICAIIFAFMPAKAPYAYYGIAPLGDFTGATSFINSMENIRNGAREIKLTTASGCVTFPSYHAASAFLFTWAAWPSILRWPTLALNIVMLVATIVVGGHYFVDLPAGIAIAATALWAVLAWQRGKVEKDGELMPYRA